MEIFNVSRIVINMSQKMVRYAKNHAHLKNLSFKIKMKVLKDVYHHVLQNILLIIQQKNVLKIKQSVILLFHLMENNAKKIAQ